MDAEKLKYLKTLISDLLESRRIPTEKDTWLIDVRIDDLVTALHLFTEVRQNFSFDPWGGISNTIVRKTER